MQITREGQNEQTYHKSIRQPTIEKREEVVTVRKDTDIPNLDAQHQGRHNSFRIRKSYTNSLTQQVVLFVQKTSPAETMSKYYRVVISITSIVLTRGFLVSLQLAHYGEFVIFEKGKENLLIAS